MKKIYSSKMIFLLSAVFVPNVYADITLKMDQDLVIGNEPMIPVMTLSGNTQYQIEIGGTSQLTMQSQYPVICNRIDGYEPITNVHVRLTDPNGDNKGDVGVDASILGVQSNVSYSIIGRVFNITSENRSKSLCLSDDEFDVIFEDNYSGTQPVSNSDITYNFISPPPGGYEPGSLMSYELTYQNNSGGQQLIDFVEYHPYTNASDAFFDPGGNISCAVLDDNDVPVPGAVCLSFEGVVSDLTLNPTEKVRLSLVRMISATSSVNTNLEMMAAVFPKVITIDSTRSSNSFSGFNSVSRKVPVVEVK